MELVRSIEPQPPPETQTNTSSSKKCLNNLPQNIPNPDDYAEGEDSADEIENLYEKIAQLEQMKKQLVSFDSLVRCNQQWETDLPSTNDFHERIESLTFFYRFLLSSKVPYHLHLGYFGLLPIEILLYLLRFLDAKSLGRISSLHSTFAELSQEPELWERLCKKDFPQIPEPPTGKTWKWLYRAQYVQFESIAQADGPGTFLNVENRGKYVGDWKNSQKHGFGWFFWADDGRRYSGHWIDDKRDGYGRYSYPDGTAYEGQWKKDKRTGFGTYSWADGRQYCGEWNSHRKNGYGIHIWPDGSTYRGNWSNGSRNGYGVFSWVDGRIYQGYWSIGKINGYGVFTWPDGDQYRGEWTHGRRVGKGIYKNAENGMLYEQWWSELKFDRTAKGPMDHPLSPSALAQNRDNQYFNFPSKSPSELATFPGSTLPSSPSTTSATNSTALQSGSTETETDTPRLIKRAKVEESVNEALED